MQSDRPKPTRDRDPRRREHATSTAVNEIAKGDGEDADGSRDGGGGRERIGNYVIGKEIGRGSFATVYKGYRSVSY